MAYGQNGVAQPQVVMTPVACLEYKQYPEHAYLIAMDVLARKWLKKDFLYNFHFRGSSTQQEKCGAPPCTFPRGACNTGYSRAAVNHTFICVPTTASTPSPTPAQTTCCPPGLIFISFPWGSSARWNSPSA